LLGIVFDTSGMVEFVNVFIEPPKLIKINNYRCDKMFDTFPILELYEQDIPIYGMVIIGGTESWFYNFNLTTNIDTKLLEHIEVLRDKRQKKGGQSAHRFQMNRLGQMRDYTKKICEKMNKHYKNNGKSKQIVSIIIVGVGDMKNTIKDNTDLIPDINNKINGVITAPTTELKDVLPVVDKHMRSLKIENKVMTEFLNLIETDPGKVSFGYTEVVKYLKEGMLEKIIVNNDCKYIEEIEELKKTLNSKVSIYKITDFQLEKFNGIVGILWYLYIMDDNEISNDEIEKVEKREIIRESDMEFLM
jgi:peptide chain release factor subunit 1